MFKSARLRLRAAVFACAAALGLGAYAATPIAVWDGNFSESATINGATFNANGNTVAEDGSYVKITGEKGAVFTLNKSYRYITAVFTVSNLNETAAYDRALATVGGGTLYGAYLQSGTLTTHGINGNAIWPTANASDYSSYDATLTSYADAETQRTFSLTQAHSSNSYSGTHLYEVYGGDTAAAIKFGGSGNNGLRAGQAYSKVVIGGMESYTEGTTLFKAASDLVILKVALYASDSTFPIAQADYATYSMPSMTVVTTPSTMSALNTAVAASSDAVALSDVSATITLDEEPSDATKSILQSAYWQGTVLIKDADKNNIVPSNYGNPNSTLKLSGVKGYFAAQQFNSSATPAIELEDSETDGREYGLWQNNGYSFYSGTSGTYQYMNTPELKGSGTYKIDTAETSSLFVADKFSNFTGKLEVTYGAVWLGVAVPSRDAAGRELVKVGTVRVSEAFVNAPLSQWTGWTVANGYLGDIIVAAGKTNNYSDNRVNFLKADSWKGTVTISTATNNTNSHVEIWLSKLGGANSTIVINDLVSGSKDYYLNEGNYQNNPTFVSTIDINGDVQFKNGSSDQTVTFDKVTSDSATDKLTFAFPTSATLNFKINSLDNFAGTLSASSRTPLTIVDILKTGATEGSLLVKVDENNANITSLSDTKLNGESADLELKNGTAGYGIYVAVPATTVDITIPEVANATVSVTTNGVAATPVNGVVTVDIGAAVVVTYTAAEGYQLTGDAISFTASASTTTVDVSSISVAAIVANVTSADGQTTTPYTSAASAIAAADDGEMVTLLEETVTLAEVLTISKSITIATGNANGTTITGSGLSAYPELAAASLTIGANVTFGSQLRVTSGDATITYPTGSVPNYRPPSGYQSQTTDNANDTSTITFYQQVYVIAAGTNATLADENGNQLGSHTPVASGDTFVFTVTPAAGCALVRVTADGVELTPSEGKYSISIGSSNVSIYAVAGVAVVTGGDSDVYCSSLQAAVDAATSGQTVTLLADDRVSFTEDNLELSIGKALTIDGAGHTIYGVNDYAGGKGDHDIYISGSGDVTIKNVTLAEFGGAVANNMRTYPIWTGSAYTGTLTLDNVTVRNFNRTAFNLNGGTVVVKDCTITGDKSKDTYFQSGIEAYNANVTVQGTTTITGTGSNLVDWPEAACLQLGSPNGSVAGTGSITVTGGTFTGDYGIIVASNASEVVSVTGGTFNGVLEVEDGEGGSLAISGGTFNAVVPEEYLAEGYEVLDNGDGTYGVREDKGWIYAAPGYWNYTGTWSEGATLGEEKVAIESNATYRATEASSKDLVTLEMTMSFEDVNDDEDDFGNAKAAIRLGAGETEGSYVFQLYTSENSTPTWKNATATGFAPVTNTDYTIVFELDLSRKTYTAGVVVGTTTNALSVGGSAAIAFAYQGAVTPVQQIDFVGSGSVSSIKGSYTDAPAPEGFVVDEEVTLAGDDTATLTAAQATWLNACGAKAAVAAKIATMTADAFNNAYLLNLDITGDFSYDFKVSNINVAGEDVTLTVSLTRTGALANKINGTVALTGTDELGKKFETISEATVADDDFSDNGSTTTITLKTGGAKFFQPVIKEPAIE